MNRISKSVSLIIRSERLMAERRMAVIGKQTGLLAFGILVAGIGVIMLTASAYLALAEWLGPPLAALIVSLVDFALAVALVMIASKQSAEVEIKPVIEVRDMAVDDLNQELQLATQDARALVEGVRAIGQNPLGLANVGMIAPLITALLKSLRK